MKRIIFSGSFLLIFICCKGLFSGGPLVKKEDYARYLRPGTDTAEPVRRIDREIQFWKFRLDKNPSDIVAQSKIAGLLSRRFLYSGNTHELAVSDSLYMISNRFNKLGTAAGFRALAINCIRRQAFSKALLYIDSAISVGDEKYSSLLVKFDAAMGLGNYAEADHCLRILGDRNNPAYLFRAAQYQDLAGRDLKGAIPVMERARASGRELADKSLFIEAGTYLAGMYARNNRVKESYKMYLDVLSDDPDHYAALEGIARLAFSVDGNIADAEQILDNLLSRHPVPACRFMLAQIAAYKNGKTAN